MAERKPRWTPKQIQILENHWDTMRDVEIAAILGRTKKAVVRKRQSLELKKALGRGIVDSYENQIKKNKLLD